MILQTTTEHLFDTTVFIGFLREQDTAGQLVSQAVETMTNKVSYSAFTEFELWCGIRGQWTEESHTELLDLFIGRPLSSAILRQASYLYQPFIANAKKQVRVPGIGDCVIAATALYYDLVVVTANEIDFRRLPCKSLFYTTQ